MTDLERRALLGDAEAQRECAERGVVLPCPFCGGRAAYNANSTSASGSLRGWRFGIECTKCGVRLPRESYLLNVDFAKDGGICVCNDERKDALRAWNARPAPPIGRCGECAAYVDNKCMNTGYYKPETGFCDDFEPKGGENNDIRRKDSVAAEVSG